MNDIEQLLEFEGCTPREDRDQFLCDQVWNSAGECIFLKDSHRLITIAQTRLYAAQFSMEKHRGETRRNDAPNSAKFYQEFL